MLAQIDTDHSFLGMDCSINPLQTQSWHNPEMKYFTISTTDFFYPLVDDPFIQGEIACANVLSDLYAQGCDSCDFMLMIVGSSLEIPIKYRTLATTLMMKGFASKAREAGTLVTGGQTVLNPWPIIGGVASKTVAESTSLKSSISPPMFLRGNNLAPGHLLVLTKPLGTQLAVNVHQWQRKNNSRFQDLIRRKMITMNDPSYDMAVKSMRSLNNSACRIMKQYTNIGSTDVTGFGILGHANNFCKSQLRDDIGIIIDSLPIIKNMDKIDKTVCDGDTFKLCRGLSSETSGGLLIAFPDQSSVEKFQAEFLKSTGLPSWKVGRVVQRNKMFDEIVIEKGYTRAALSPKCEIIQVEKY